MRLAQHQNMQQRLQDALSLVPVKTLVATVLAVAVTAVYASEAVVVTEAVSGVVD